MNKIFILIIIIIFVVIYQYYTINTICYKEPEYFIYQGKTPGPTILIVATTHGNEPGGYYAIRGIMDQLNQQKISLIKGRIIFVPIVNYCGYQLNNREHNTVGDINRLYLEGTNMNIINDLVIRLSKEADFIVDFHEGWDFNKMNNLSLGSTITPSQTKISKEVAKLVVNNINQNITESNKKFSVIKYQKCIGTLTDYYQMNKDYILIELTGQNDIQPKELRKNQGMSSIKTVLNYFDLIQ